MTAPTLPLVTPTGVLLMTAEQIRDRGAWLAERRNGIGSSDIAGVVGVADWATAVHVWRDKLGEKPDDAGEAALWGNLLEDVVAQEWCRRNRSVIEDMGLIAHHDHPWMRASLDRRVHECPLDPKRSAVCALEVKTRSAFKSARWHASVPDDVLAQTTWQMVVSGFDHIHVAVLIGGNSYHQTVVRREAELESYLVGQATAFWEINVGRRVEPEWDMNKADRLNELDELMYPDRVGELDIDGIGEVLEYAEISARKGALEKELKAARARLAQLAAGHQYVKFGGDLAYELAPVTRSSCDLAQLAERFPEAYEACVMSSTSHQIRIAKALRRSAADVA